MKFEENNNPKSPESNIREVLDAVATLRASLENLDIVLEHTFPDNWAFDKLEAFLKAVESNPSAWTAEKVRSDFKVEADRLSEPPHIAHINRKSA